MPLLVNINGELCTGEEARVPVLDRGFLYGDSVYEVVRTYQGKPFAVAEHLDRLERSAARLEIKLREREWLVEQIHKTIRTAFNPESYCRIMVTRGGGPITLDPTLAEKPTTVILVKQFDPFPSWMYDKGIKVTIPRIRRNPPTALDPAIKSGNYLNSILAFGEARKQGFDDAIMLDATGRVTEATSANVFAYREGTLCTPALETGILEGVTRKFVLTLARELNIPAEACDLVLDDLLSADEVMFSSTLKEVMPVTQVNQDKIGKGQPGPTAARLRERLREFALERIRAQDHRK